MSRGRAKTMSDEEIISLVREHPDRAVTAKELAEVVEMTSQGLLKRLNDLEDRGPVTKKTVGANAVVWWVPDAQASEA